MKSSFKKLGASFMALFLMLMCFPFIKVMAEDSITVEVGGLKYSLDQSAHTASVEQLDSYSERKAVSVPSSITHNEDTYTVTSIGMNAFYGCSKLESIELPSSVTSIGGYAFFECSKLKSINIQGVVTHIGGYVFRGCSSLESIEIPSSVTAIYDHTFYGCSNLKSINIQGVVTHMGGGVFTNCESLTSIAIPCNFNKAMFTKNSSSVIPSETDDTFTIKDTTTTGTFKYMHEFENASYQWSDDFSTCRATGTCSKCGHEGTEDATVRIQKNEIGSWPKSKVLLHKAEFTQSGFDVQIKRELFCSTKLNGEDINCIVQDPNDAIPAGTYSKITLVEPGTPRWNELNSQLDDTHRIENIAFFEIELLDVETTEPIKPMPLSHKVRVLLKIPTGWDKEDMEAVLVRELGDLDFEENIVKIDGVDYVAFWTDHFSPYAMIDKLNDNEISDPTDPSTTTDDLDNEEKLDSHNLGQNDDTDIQGIDDAKDENVKSDTNGTFAKTGDQIYLIAGMLVFIALVCGSLIVVLRKRKVV